MWATWVFMLQIIVYSHGQQRLAKEYSECTDDQNYCYQSDVCAYVFTLPSNENAACQTILDTVVNLEDVEDNVELLDDRMNKLSNNINIQKQEFEKWRGLIVEKYYLQELGVSDLQGNIQDYKENIEDSLRNKTDRLEEIIGEQQHRQEIEISSLQENMEVFKLHVYRSLEVFYEVTVRLENVITNQQHTIDELKIKLDHRPSVDELKETEYETDCSEILEKVSKSGVYSIKPAWSNQSFEVYCDMDTDSGGWTVLQRREDGSVNFYHYWEEYKLGFGNLSGEFWLGNDKIHQLSTSSRYELRIDMESFDGDKAYAKYDSFYIEDESNKYKLHIGNYSGNAGDSLTYHNEMLFSTRERDNDESSRNCAMNWAGPWWYKSCLNSNLNGLYLANLKSVSAVIWLNWEGNEFLKSVEMKIRPVL
ncbi:fibroleukin-like [Glandiceps talaboti]